MAGDRHGARPTVARALLSCPPEPCGVRVIDLWQLNVLVAGPDDVTVTGVLDWDAASWGDPLADWTIHQVRLRAGKSDVDAFWEMYGPPPDDADAGVRQLLYEARSRAGSRLDIHRRGLDTASINPVHWDVADIADAAGVAPLNHRAMTTQEEASPWRSARSTGSSAKIFCRARRATNYIRPSPPARPRRITNHSDGPRRTPRHQHFGRLVSRPRSGRRRC